MSAERLQFIFEIMVYVGIGLPLINLLLGALTSSGGADSDLDLDVDADLELDLDLDLDAPDGGAGPARGGAVSRGGNYIQFNLYCLCLALVIMGGVGIFALNTTGNVAGAVPILAVGFLLALAGYVLLYRLVVRRLKQNDASALNMRTLVRRRARVTFRILIDSPGKIQTKDNVGAFITYPAELDRDVCLVDRIDEGEEVIITEVDTKKQVCYVSLSERKLLS